MTSTPAFTKASAADEITEFALGAGPPAKRIPTRRMFDLASVIIAPRWMWVKMIEVCICLHLDVGAVYHNQLQRNMKFFSVCASLQLMRTSGAASIDVHVSDSTKVRSEFA